MNERLEKIIEVNKDHESQYRVNVLTKIVTDHSSDIHPKNMADILLWCRYRQLGGVGLVVYCRVLV